MGKLLLRGHHSVGGCDTLEGLLHWLVVVGLALDVSTYDPSLPHELCLVGEDLVLQRDFLDVVFVSDDFVVDGMLGRKLEKDRWIGCSWDLFEVQVADSVFGRLLCLRIDPTLEFTL